jgi:glutamate racemase
LLVPLVEEGWIEHPVTLEVLRIYLSELMEHAHAAKLNADTLVLGCTHYPLLRTQIERTAPLLHVIDSAEVTAKQVAAALGEQAHSGFGLRRFYATDSVSKFRNLGTRFLGEALDGVSLVDLGG